MFLSDTHSQHNQQSNTKKSEMLKNLYYSFYIFSCYCWRNGAKCQKNTETVEKRNNNKTHDEKKNENLYENCRSVCTRENEKTTRERAPQEGWITRGIPWCLCTAMSIQNEWNLVRTFLLMRVHLAKKEWWDWSQFEGREWLTRVKFTKMEREMRGDHDVRR